MMEIAALTKAAATISAIAVIGGGTLTLDHLHASSSDFEKHLSEQRVQTVFSYMAQIDANGPVDWLCRALDEELYQLCSELPEHAMCRDGAREGILEEAGC